MSDPVEMTRQEFTELEMTYTSFHDACRDPFLEEDNLLRQCRRFRGHVGLHASGFPFREWANEGDTP